MQFSTTDILLTSLFAIGLFQVVWLSVVLIRKGFAPSVVRFSLLPLLSIWVLIWPAYTQGLWLMSGFALFLLPIIFAWRSNKAFARHIKLCWHTTPETQRQPAPWLVYLSSLFIAAILFYQAPELGLGVALSVCLAWPAAELLDKAGKGLLLGFALHPNQTLFGHIILVLGASLICAWGLQLYHGVVWYQFFIATLMAGFVASAIRGLTPIGWNMPLAFLGMSLTLWVL